MNAIQNILARRIRLREVSAPLNGGHVIAFEAIQNGQVVGRGSASLRGRTVVIDELDVSPASRGHGIGRKLVKAILSKSQLFGSEQACVTARNNEGFWALQGFRPSACVAANGYPECALTMKVPPILPPNPFR